MSKIDKLRELAQKDRVLGREGILSQTSAKVYEIDMNKITPNPFQPRVVFKESEIDELTESIEKNGLLQPILLTTNDRETFTIIAGERRFRAFQKLKKNTIQAIVVEKVSHAKLATFSLVENLERSRLHPIEIALAFQKCLAEGVYKNQNEIAEAMGLSKSQISKLFSIAGLPHSLLQLAQSSNYQDIEVLSMLKGLDEGVALEVLNTIIKRNIQRVEAREMIKSSKTASTPLKQNPTHIKKNRQSILLKINLKRISQEARERIEKKLEEIADIAKEADTNEL